MAIFNNNYEENIIELKNSVGSEENIDIYLMEYCQSGQQQLSSKYVALNKLAIIDCDGVISNGKSYYSKEGKYLKAYGCYDKEMIRLLSKYNWNFIFVSDDKKGIEITKKRISDLKSKENNIEFLNANSAERYELVKKMKEEYEYVIFIGDSLSDIPSLVAAQISGCPANAPEKVKKFSRIISDYEGGNGAVADILYIIHRFNGEI